MASRSKSDERAPQESRLILDKTVKRLNRDRLLESELAGLNARLHADPAQWTDRNALVERRNELIKLVPKVLLNESFLQARKDAIVLRISELLRPWTVLNLPYMYEGINETPGSNGTDGEIGTDGLFAGGCGYGGTLYDNTSSHTEKWWIHNWRNSIVFPASPFAGRLYYRFTVDSECHIYNAPVYSGTVREFVTIGSTPDSLVSPDDWTNWATVGWPVDATLPSSKLNYAGAVPVLGSIAVQAGKNAALGFVYGTIVSVASGYVMFSWGNFGTRRTVPASTPVDYTLYDKIEYRFEPTWWLEAIARAVAFELSP
jgi:hypothetical protein